MVCQKLSRAFRGTRPHLKGYGIVLQQYNHYNVVVFLLVFFYAGGNDIDIVKMY